MDPNPSRNNPASYGGARPKTYSSSQHRTGAETSMSQTAAIIRESYQAIGRDPTQPNRQEDAMVNRLPDSQRSTTNQRSRRDNNRGSDMANNQGGAAAGAGGGGADSITMRSPSYGNELLSSLRSLRVGDELTDFTVTAAGRTLQVHKVLLAATSDYFRAMLNGPMRESQEARVDLKGLSENAMVMIIDFIYTGEMSLNLNNLLEILNAGSHLQIRTALDLCSDYMISLISFLNAEDMMHIADTYSLQKVKDYYHQKVLRQFQEFTSSDLFLKLKADKLAEYLGEDDLVVRCEVSLYEAVSRWFAHDQTRRESLNSVVQKIRFCLLSEQYLLNLSNHWLTRQCTEETLQHINVGLSYVRSSPGGWPLRNIQQGAGAGDGTDHVWRTRASKPSLVLVNQASSFKPLELVAYNEPERKFYQVLADGSGCRDCRVVQIENFVFLCRVVDCGGGTLMNSMMRFDPRHLSLVELSPCRHLRIDCAVVVKEHIIYVFGGTTHNSSTQFLDSVEYYDTHTNRWSEDIPMPSPTHSHAGVYCGDLIYVSGGVSAQSDLQPSNLLHAYNPTDRRWTMKEPMRCARRLHEMLTLDDSKIYVLGGIGGHNVNQQTQIPIEVYDTAKNQWSILTTTLAGRSIGHFLVHDNSILSVGREHQSATEDEIWRYDTQTDSWSTFARTSRKNGLPPAAATSLHINFNDEKIFKRAIPEKR